MGSVLVVGTAAWYLFGEPNRHAYNVSPPWPVA